MVERLLGGHCNLRVYFWTGKIGRGRRNDTEANGFFEGVKMNEALAWKDNGDGVERAMGSTKQPDERRTGSESFLGSLRVS